MTTISTISTTAYTSWHEDPNECAAFLDLLNIDGFILEEAVREAILQSSLGATVRAGEVFEGAPHREKDRVEIDLCVKINNFVFVIESKRSDFDWVFSKNINAPNDIHLIAGPNKEQLFVTNRTLPVVECVSKQIIEVLGDSSKPILCRQQKNQKLPIRSAREEYARGAARQALFNMETLIASHLSDPTWTGQAARLFIPIVVTNARLLSASYDSPDIDREAQLTKVNFQPIQAAAFNHAEILRWGASYDKELAHVGRPHDGTSFCGDNRYKGSHNKTVFIVTKDHLVAFINTLMKAPCFSGEVYQLG